MTYYRKEEDAAGGDKDKSAGSIDLEQATAVEVTQSSAYFEITTPSRVWKLQADSTLDAVSWARDILRASAARRERGGGGQRKPLACLWRSQAPSCLTFD